MANKFSTPTRLFAEHKKKSQNDFIQWWLMDQQRQMNVEDQTNSSHESMGPDNLSTPYGAWVQASLNPITCSTKEPPRMGVSKRPKRVFDLISDSTSSSATSHRASVTSRSNSPSTKHLKTRSEGEKEAPTAGSSTSAFKEEKNFPGRDTGAAQGVKVITRGIGDMSLMKGKPLLDADYAVTMPSRNPSSL